MSYTQAKLDELTGIVDRRAVAFGATAAPIPDVGFFRNICSQEKTHTIYEPALVILVNGRKDCRVGEQEKSYEYDTIHCPSFRVATCAVVDAGVNTLATLADKYTLTGI